MYPGCQGWTKVIIGKYESRCQKLQDGFIFPVTRATEKIIPKREKNSTVADYGSRFVVFPNVVPFKNAKFKNHKTSYLNISYLVFNGRACIFPCSISVTCQSDSFWCHHHHTHHQIKMHPLKKKSRKKACPVAEIFQFGAWQINSSLFT